MNICLLLIFKTWRGLVIRKMRPEMFVQNHSPLTILPSLTTSSYTSSLNCILRLAWCWGVRPKRLKPQTKSKSPRPKSLIQKAFYAKSYPKARPLLRNRQVPAPQEGPSVAIGRHGGRRGQLAPVMTLSVETLKGLRGAGEMEDGGHLGGLLSFLWCFHGVLGWFYGVFLVFTVSDTRYQDHQHPSGRFHCFTVFTFWNIQYFWSVYKQMHIYRFLKGFFWIMGS